MWETTSFSWLTKKPGPSCPPLPSLRHQHTAQGFSWDPPGGSWELGSSGRWGSKRHRPSGNITPCVGQRCTVSVQSTLQHQSFLKESKMKESRTNTAPSPISPINFYPGSLRAPSRALPGPNIILVPLSLPPHPLHIQFGTM